jgi:hypothetical protein
MKHGFGLAAALLIVGIASPGAQAQGQGGKAPEMKMSAVPQTPEWQRLKALVGNWEGTVEMEG